MLKKSILAVALLTTISVAEVKAMYQQPNNINMQQFFQQMMQQQQQDLIQSQKKGQESLFNNSREFDLEKDIPNDDTLKNIITKNHSGDFQIKLSDGKTFNVDNIRVIDRESILKNYKNTDTLLSKEEIINWFTKEVQIFIDKKDGKQQSIADIKKIISALLDKDGEKKDFQKFFDTFIKVSRQKNKKLMFSMKKAEDGDNPITYEVDAEINFCYKDLPDQQIDIIPYPEYPTIHQYHPQYNNEGDKNKPEYYNYNLNEDVTKGVLFCHELNHILDYWLQGDLSSEQLNIKNINGQLIENLGLNNIDLTKNSSYKQQQLWNEIGEYFNITGFLPVEADGKVTLYINKLYSDFGFLCKLGLPARWGHITTGYCPPFYYPARMIMFLDGIDKKLKIKNTEKKVFEYNISNLTKQYEAYLQNKRLPDDNQLKLYFALLGINKTDYEKNLELNKEQRKAIMQEQDDKIIDEAVELELK